MKKIILILFMGVLLLTGCDKQEKVESNIASKLVSEFKEEIKSEKNIETIANNIAKNEAIEIAVDAMEVEENYVSGITKELPNYKKAYVIRPMIGSIPFIAYIFEVDNASEFENFLKENADKRWNICTEADTIESYSTDNYVFFVMSPETFDE